ncbi:glyoxalase superfamily protein [Cognatiyoonia sp.]|uniref:glyoxalase superfamily protein n=1 Tax=Cognatiyoonia sp. TaxID=2211652 RepID=UPI003F695D30
MMKENGHADSRDPKTMAKTLRSLLVDDNVTKSHSECLEIVAKQLGFADWNTASAVTNGPKTSTALVVPEGWRVGGEQAQDYRVGIDPDAAGPPTTIRSVRDSGEQSGWATLMQSIDGAAYRGKRVQLTADLKCDECLGAATLWLRANSADGRVLMLNNMEAQTADGFLTGTVDWALRQIVFDVR